MSNHIKAKFFDISYSKIPKFSEYLDELIDILRKGYPTQIIHDLHKIEIKFDGENTPSKEQLAGKEVYLIDAEGKYGLKIGNAGLSMSVDGYIDYSNMISQFEGVCNDVKKVLGITHYSKVSLRNINIFDEVDNNFEDIKDREIWGRQDFDSLKKSNFTCSGAATRHEYLSPDYKKTLHVASSIIMQGSSYIPQEEWDIWNLRGAIPAIDSAPKLLIELTSTHYQYSLNEPQKKNNVRTFDWENIKEELTSNHKLVNSVYVDITTEEEN